MVFLNVFTSRNLEYLKILINSLLEVYVNKRVYRYGTVLISGYRRIERKSDFLW